MSGVSGAWLRDAGERVGFTALEAGAGVAVVLVTPLATWWAAPIAAALAGVKAWAAKRVGEKGTAALLPEPKS